MSASGTTFDRHSRIPWRTGLVVVLALSLAAATLGDPYTLAVLVILGVGTAALVLVPLTRSVPALIFLIPFRLYLDLPGAQTLEVALTNCVVVGLGVVCLASVLLRDRPRLTGWELMIAAWVAWTLASLVWTSQPR